MTLIEAIGIAMIVCGCWFVCLGILDLGRHKGWWR